MPHRPAKRQCIGLSYDRPSEDADWEPDGGGNANLGHETSSSSLDNVASGCSSVIGLSSQWTPIGTRPPPMESKASSTDAGSTLGKQASASGVTVSNHTVMVQSSGGKILDQVSSRYQARAEPGSSLSESSVSNLDSTAIRCQNGSSPAYRTIADIPHWRRDRGGLSITNLPSNVPEATLVEHFKVYSEKPGSIIETGFGYTKEGELAKGESMTAWLWILYAHPREAEHASSDMFAANIGGRQIDIELFTDSLATANMSLQLASVSPRGL